MDNTYHLFVFSLNFYHISPLLKINSEFTVAFLGLRFIAFIASIASIAFVGFVGFIGFFLINDSTTQLFNFFTLCASAVSFDFGHWTLD